VAGEVPSVSYMVPVSLTTRQSGVASDSSEHKPWGGIDNAEPISWKSEGSICSPQVFKTKLALARRHRRPDSKETPAISVTGPPDTSHRSANRNALVFERQIILNSGGQTTRLSLQASSKSMDPGVAEMISELQNLNSFFQEQDANARPPAPPPPSLVVSNSHFSLPVSLESSGNLTPGVPLALAARRGKKMLPPLSVKQSSDESEYPSMPTAFLGSPSTYSPKFEFASHPNRRSMDLQQMVTSLRSQCASIDSATPPDEIQETEADGEEDEWAFANGFLDVHSSRPFDSDFVKKPLLPHMVDYAEESLTDSPSSSYRGPVSAINAPPSTPLPPRPAQRTSVRSILKSSKSVRFASLPNERPESVEVPTVVIPRRSLGPSSPPIKRSLPPRPRSHTVRPTIPAPLASPPPKPTPTLGRVLDQRRATAPGTSYHLASPASSPARPSVTPTPTRTPPKKAAVSGRRSLSRVFSAATVTKENKPSSPNTPTTAPSRARWTLNENVLRRASVCATPTEAQTQTHKTRMPVPLRNILTRFK
jgi:hypothetical protein